MSIVMRDPTAEIAPVARPRVKPPASLDGLTVGLLCIGKERSLEFLDRVALRLNERGIVTRRYAKPTHTKKAPVALLQRIATECQVVVEGLAD